MTKYEWHEIYRYSIYRHFNWECQNCKSKKRPQVHHKTYRHKKGVYNITAEEAIKEDIVTVLCEKCHIEIHKNESIDGLTQLLPPNYRPIEKRIYDEDDIVYFSIDEQFNDELTSIGCYDSIYINGEYKNLDGADSYKRYFEIYPNEQETFLD